MILCGTRPCFLIWTVPWLSPASNHGQFRPSAPVPGSSLYIQCGCLEIVLVILLRLFMSTAQHEESPNVDGEAAQNSPPPWLQLPRPLCLALLLLAIIFFGLIRYRLRDMPLERDEGEYAYSGQLLLQGIPPYKLAYNMKLPGIYAAYTGILAVFGESPAGIHLGLLLVNAASILILYFLTALQFGRLAAAVAACSYALLSTSSSVMGFEAHATNFVVLPAMLGILFLLLALRSKRTSLFFLGGLCSGMAILMKQHGLFFAAFCFLYLLWIHRKQRAHSATVIRHAGASVFGGILPSAATCF